MAQTAQPLDITAAGNVLKKVYTSDNITSQLNEDTVLLSRIEQTTDYHDAVGDKAVLFAKTGRNVGVSARSLNGGTLGAAGHQQTQKLEVDYTANYVQIKVLGTTIAKMNTARQAATRALTMEVDGAIEDLRKDLQRQLYGDGTGRISACITTSASATVNLNVTAGYDAIVRGWLQPGQYVDLGTASSPSSVVADAKIASVVDSSTAPQIVIDSSVTTSSSTYVGRAGNRTGSTSYELNGLQNIVSASSVLHGLDPASEVTWKGNTIDAASAVLSRSMMQRAYRAQRQYGGKPDFIVTSLEQADDFQNTLTSQVRFTSVSSVKDSSLDGPEFNGVPVLGDPDCPRGVMYFLSTKDLMMVSAGPIKWQNTNTGGDVLAWSQGEDGFVARAAYYANLATDKRRAHAAITAIAQPS